jgi:hypothetical protein
MHFNCADHNFGLKVKKEAKMRGPFVMTGFKTIALYAFLILTVNGTAAAGGFLGTPQTVSKEAGGLFTAIGYVRQEDTYRNDKEFVIRQNQVYSQFGYGAQHWEIYGRFGVSDLKISDAFRSTQTSTTTSKNDFTDSGKFFGTLGAKGFYPFNKTFGIGAFMQSTYYFNDSTEPISGTYNGVPFRTELKVKNLWDVNFGLGFQVTVPYGIKLYIGPYTYYSEAQLSLSANIPGLNSDKGNVTVHNKTNIGGFTGVDVPLAKGFHLNVEGQYSEYVSVGIIVTYLY